MNAAFVLSGVLLLGGVVGFFQAIAGDGRPLLRWASAVLLALSPIGLVLAGIFDLEAPLLHLSGALLGLASPVLSFLALGLLLRGLPGWRRVGTCFWSPAR